MPVYEFSCSLLFTPTQSFISYKNLIRVIITCFHHISFDAKFYANFEFSVKISFPPTHFEISAVLWICVSGSQNFLRGWNENKISDRMMCKSYIFWLISHDSGNFSENEKVKITLEWNWISKIFNRRQLIQIKTNFYLLSKFSCEYSKYQNFCSKVFDT